MKRRELLKGTAGLATAVGSGSLLWSPYAPAAAHDAYFSGLNDLLKREGPGRPVMLIDTERMNHNIDVLTSSVGPEKTYRVVVKSLPSVGLLENVLRRAKTRSLMVFHQPFLNAIADAFPNADALLGKPMPVRAARTFYRKLGETTFDAANQVQWLIDSRERLLQYQALARELGVRMRVNLEIDVGLHRGGLPEPAALGSVLKVIQGDPEHLSFSGFMGYEPHLTGQKASLDHPAVQDVLGVYRGFLDGARTAGVEVNGLTLNGAGSHTLRIYERDKTMNDLSAGSGVVMPTDFDTFHLSDNLPALFIATPVLKRYDGNPYLPDAPDLMQRLYYIYGGYWKARMVSPAEVGEPIYQSTNQSPITTSRKVDLRVDDYVFLRPTQSEFVMLQFGDLLAVKGGTFTDRWPVFHQTG
ncbi:MAG: alanine racemase [Gammaproteobacteria bacterium]|nr:alanine racemase [Gammaproteobacteria bacterium]